MPRIRAGAARVKMAPEERVWLLPALEFATEHRNMRRDGLYASICVTPPARAAHACADFPPKLNDVWERREKWKAGAWWYGANGLAAALYAWKAISAHRKGKKVSSRFAGIG